MGLGPPAGPGDIAVPRDYTGRVDFFTADGRYKFGTSPFDCATGNSLGATYFSNDNGAQAIMGCAIATLLVPVSGRVAAGWDSRGNAIGGRPGVLCTCFCGTYGSGSAAPCTTEFVIHCRASCIS